ncbi:MAG: molybdopterin-dependent oxidoreductase [Anaerolineae bacterium]|nr:molybdopterin-dependent oxidoreductase [Anaerolineae bacterium]
MVHITIDGKTIEVPEGTTVLRAAEKAGVFIPTLCDHPHLTPYGGCRLCLVEVEGMRGLQPSCTLPAANNMVVRTDSEKLRASRKFVLTMLFSERNHFCPYCVVTGGDCELQNAAYGEGMTHWPLQPNWQPYTVDATHPYFVLDHNRCILCRRCVRACGELVGNFTLGFEERGAQSVLVADLGTPLGESTCISCGTCVQVCPTGALIDRVSAYRGRDTQVNHNKTICVGCSVGCGIDVLTRDNQIVRIESDWDAPVNHGVICKLGRFVPLFEEKERINTPLVKKDGKLKAATWDEAISTIVSHLKPLVNKKSDGVAAMVSTRMPAETLYLFKEIFANGFKSDMVTSSEEGIPSAAPAALADELGKPFEGKLSALENADCVVIMGADLINKHEVAGFFVKRILPKGTKLIVLDVEDNPIADLADMVIKPTKGNESDLVKGLLAAVAKVGNAKATVKIQPPSLEKVESTTGVKSEQLIECAKMILESEQPVFIYGKGLTAQGSAEAVKPLLDLARLCGVISDNYNGLINVKGKANSLAAAQYKLDQPFALNGHQAAYIVLGDDDPSQRLIKSLEKAPFLAVQASYASQLTAMADVVLPVQTWAEQEGHYLSLEGYLQTAKKSVDAPEEIKSNNEVLKEIASKLGIKANGEAWQKQLTARTCPVSIIEI